MVPVLGRIGCRFRCEIKRSILGNMVLYAYEMTNPPETFMALLQIELSRIVGVQQRFMVQSYNVINYAILPLVILHSPANSMCFYRQSNQSV
jgi:hypothetical protein